MLASWSLNIHRDHKTLASHAHRTRGRHRRWTTPTRQPHVLLTILSVAEHIDRRRTPYPRTQLCLGPYLKFRVRSATIAAQRRAGSRLLVRNHAPQTAPPSACKPYRTPHLSAQPHTRQCAKRAPPDCLRNRCSDREPLGFVPHRQSPLRKYRSLPDRAALRRIDRPQGSDFVHWQWEIASRPRVARSWLRQVCWSVAQGHSRQCAML